MRATILSIDGAGPGLRARRVRLDDGTERVTSASVVKKLDLKLGMSVELTALESELSATEDQLGRERALRLLGYRERSARELTRRLRDDGFAAATADEVVASLAESGLVDDARFAEQLVRIRISAGYGLNRIRRELAEHGIAREDAERAIVAADVAHDDAERLRALISARPPANPRERERILRKLVGKGFAPGDVIDALKAADRECD